MAAARGLPELSPQMQAHWLKRMRLRRCFAAGARALRVPSPGN